MPASPWVVAAVSCVAAAVLFPVYRALVGKAMVQRFREAGPEHHLAKGQVPTGSGVVLLLLLAAAAAYAIFATEGGAYWEVSITVCLAAVVVGLLGLIDDRAKVLRGSEGLRARYKLPIMVAVGLILLYVIQHNFVVESGPQGGGIHLPWPAQAPLWLFYLAGLFVWLGALNGANFTDGLDGLLSTTTLVLLAGVFFALLDGSEPLALPASVGFGVLVAFLFFNWKPAKLYIGDSGALAVGALAAGLFLAKGWWLFLGLCALVWVIEVLSVMIQVASFRLTGKRPFLMTPLHHHFELAGWGERTTVFVFTALQVAGCIVAFAWLRYGVAYGLTGTAVLLAVIALLLLTYYKPVQRG